MFICSHLHWKQHCSKAKFLGLSNVHTSTVTGVFSLYGRLLSFSCNNIIQQLPGEQDRHPLWAMCKRFHWNPSLVWIKPSLTALQLCFCITQAPFIWSTVTEITPPPLRDNFARRLYGIWQLLTFIRPGYIFDKIADDRKKKKNAVNILITACARTFYSSCLVSDQPDKVLTWEKVAPPARATLPAEMRQLAPLNLFRLPETSSQPQTVG